MSEEPKTVPARDGCVVESEPLSLIIGGFVSRWDPPTGRSTMSPIEWLSEQTAIPERTIANVAKATYRTTELRIADALVAAVGCPEAFHNGTLTIRGNPLAKREDRDRCCGGSEG